MKCDDANEIISEYISGELDSALSVSLENHLAACDECRQMVADFRVIWPMLDSMPAVELPDGDQFHSKLMSQVLSVLDEQENAEATRKAKVTWSSAFKPRVLAYAASVAALLMIGAGGLHYSKAGLDPIGSVINLFKPTPPTLTMLASTRAEWAPNAQGSGELMVHLIGAAPAPTLHCIVNVPQQLKTTDAKYEVDVVAGSEVKIPIPMKSKPSAADISVTCSTLRGGEPKTEPVQLMEPIQPSAQ